MLIKFVKTFNGSNDGITLTRFKEGGTYKVPSDLNLELATVALENKYAVKVEDEALINEVIDKHILKKYDVVLDEEVEVEYVEPKEPVQEVKKEKFGFKGKKRK